MRIFSLLPGIAAWLFFLTTLCAHPVAQGSADLRIAPDHLLLRMRVSVEQVFVETSFGKDGGPAAATLDQLWPAHGSYLLRRVQITADGASLQGRVTAVSAPPRPVPEEFVVYELRYDFPAPKPGTVIAREDLLNEFSFAPGNPWEATFVARVEQEGQPAREALLLTSKQPLEIRCDWSGKIIGSGGIDQRQLLSDYGHHGFMHILEGWDHLLFMAALVLAATRFWDLVKVVTAFTVSHTITLALSVLGIFRLPSHIVEPMIAASIVFVAVQNIFWPERSRGWGRLWMAFGFGLFHGLGFAGGLMEAMEGLPGLAVATAIVAFSVGVELGHQVIVLPVYFGLRLMCAARENEGARQRISLGAMRGGSAFISCAGIFYFVAALRG